MDLLTAMNREYSTGKRWLVGAAILAAPFSICSLIGSLGSLKLAGWLALATFVLEVLIVNCRGRSGVHYRRGEAVRRLAMLLDGLNRQPSADEIQVLAARLGVTEGANKIEARTYYASKSPPGANRLLEIVQESSFWTAALAERTAQFLGFGLGVAVFLMIVALYAAIQTGYANNYRSAAAKALLFVATMLLAGDVAQLRQQYSDLAEAAERARNRCVAELRTGCASASEAMVTTDEYNCALAAAPIIPEFVYRLRKKRLNQAWTAQCNPPRCT